jgi:hypothetical protein
VTLSPEDERTFDVALAVLEVVLRRATGRAAVEQWAARHGYRLTRCSTAWTCQGTSFAPELGRWAPSDIYFTVEVDEQRLGVASTAVVQHRARGLGLLAEDIDPRRDVLWVSAPDRHGAEASR